MIATAIALASGFSLVNLLVYLLVLAIVIYIVYLIVQWLPLPGPVKQIAVLIIGLVGLLYVLSALGVMSL
jgi:uncharacterized membrane protein